MKNIIVTSSGTNLGKTLVTCAITKAIIKSKKTVHAVKPIISGFNANIVPNDLFYICEALGVNYLTAVDEVNFAAFKKAMSPDMAARLSKQAEVNFNKMISFINQKRAKDYLVVETAGGIMVPVNSKHTTLDMIKKTADSVIMVTGSYLGSLSHTIASYEVLKLHKKTPKLVVVTQNMGRREPLYIPVKETIKSLENFVSSPIIGVEKLTGSENAKINKLSNILSDAKILQIISR